MSRRTKYILIGATGVFVGVQVVLAALIQARFADGGHPSSLMFSVVFAAAVFAVIFSIIKRNNINLILLALIVTLVADVFLVLEAGEYLYGVGVFCLAQFLYMAETMRGQKPWLKIVNGLSRAVVFVIVLGAAWDMIGGALEAVTAFYFVNLAVSAVFACIAIKKNPLLAAGLVLFVACDVFVGLDYILGGGWTMAAAWAFYVPSQTLLALAVIKARGLGWRKNEKKEREYADTKG